MTAVTSTEEKNRGLNLGAIDYVTKPFDAAELQARVRGSLRNKELLDLLSKKSMIDGLTGLWNRSYLNQRLGEEIAYAKRHKGLLSCVMLDVDHFNTINDTHGHGFGDMVLKGITSVLQQLSRTDTCEIGNTVAANKFVRRRRGGRHFPPSHLASKRTIAKAIQLSG